jgi:hypothetical protein
MKKILFIISVIIPLSFYSVRSQNNSNEPVLTIAQKKDSSSVVNPNQESDTKIPRTANFSSVGKNDDTETTIPKVGIMQKKKKPVKGFGKKK